MKANGRDFWMRHPRATSAAVVAVLVLYWVIGALAAVGLLKAVGTR